MGITLEEKKTESNPAAEPETGTETEAETEVSSAMPAGPGENAPGEAASSERSANTTAFSVAVVFSFVLALLAATVTGFLWWQYRQFYVSLDAADADAERALESARASIRRAEDRIDSLATTLESNRAGLTQTDDRLERLSSQLAATDRRVEALQGGSFDARAQWLRSEAEFYLATANTELQIGSHWERSIRALELADQTLEELADPALGPVREAIADELIALRAVRLPDIEGLIFSLGRLAERVDALPLRSGRPVDGAAPLQESPGEDAEPGLARLWLSFKRALASIIRVERSDEPVTMQLSAQESRLVREQVVLEIQLAEVAALRPEPAAFKTSLGAAIDLLRRNFDTTSAEVDGAVALLQETRRLEIAPAKPDISGSLSRLRSARGGDD